MLFCEKLTKNSSFEFQKYPKIHMDVKETAIENFTLSNWVLVIRTVSKKDVTLHKTIEKYKIQKKQDIQRQRLYFSAKETIEFLEINSILYEIWCESEQTKLSCFEFWDGCRLLGNPSSVLTWKQKMKGYN